jgi:hypothetical protein
MIIESANMIYYFANKIYKNIRQLSHHPSRFLMWSLLVFPQAAVANSITSFQEEESSHEEESCLIAPGVDLDYFTAPSINATYRVIYLYEGVSRYKEALCYDIDKGHVDKNCLPTQKFISLLSQRCNVTKSEKPKNNHFEWETTLCKGDTQFRIDTNRLHFLSQNITSNQELINCIKNATVNFSDLCKINIIGGGFNVFIAAIIIISLSLFSLCDAMYLINPSDEDDEVVYYDEQDIPDACDNSKDLAFSKLCLGLPIIGHYSMQMCKLATIISLWGELSEEDPDLLFPHHTLESGEYYYYMSRIYGFFGLIYAGFGICAANIAKRDNVFNRFFEGMVQSAEIFATNLFLSYKLFGSPSNYQANIIIFALVALLEGVSESMKYDPPSNHSISQLWKETTHCFNKNKWWHMISHGGHFLHTLMEMPCNGIIFSGVALEFLHVFCGVSLPTQGVKTLTLASLLITSGMAIQMSFYYNMTRSSNNQDKFQKIWYLRLVYNILFELLSASAFSSMLLNGNLDFTTPCKGSPYIENIAVARAVGFYLGMIRASEEYKKFLIASIHYRRRNNSLQTTYHAKRSLQSKSDFDEDLTKPLLNNGDGVEKISIEDYDYSPPPDEAEIKEEKYSREELEEFARSQQKNQTSIDEVSPSVSIDIIYEDEPEPERNNMNTLNDDKNSSKKRQNEHQQNVDMPTLNESLINHRKKDGVLSRLVVHQPNQFGFLAKPTVDINLAVKNVALVNVLLSYPPDNKDESKENIINEDKSLPNKLQSENEHQQTDTLTLKENLGNQRQENEVLDKSIADQINQFKHLAKTKPTVVVDLTVEDVAHVDVLFKYLPDDTDESKENAMDAMDEDKSLPKKLQSENEHQQSVDTLPSKASFGNQRQEDEIVDTPITNQLNQFGLLAKMKQGIDIDLELENTGHVKVLFNYI